MNKHSIAAGHNSGLSFDIEMGPFRITTDGSTLPGGKKLGPNPKPLLLAALAGCSGIDVVGVMKKQRVEYEAFNIEIDGEVSEELPNVYKEISVRYIFKGHNLPKAKIERAIDLSLNKYCGVAATLRLAGANIAWELHLLEV